MDVLLNEASMWRYPSHLPLADAGARISMGEGWTPLVPAPRYAARVGCRAVWIKDEAQNPTGTFKDRSAAYTISRLREQGCAGIVLNSTGNASASFAVYAARANMACVTVVPTDVLGENLLQMSLAGARVHCLSDWAGARSFAQGLARQTGYMNVSADNAPTREQAKQTVGLEIVEQLGWRFPAAVFCPTGGGIALLAIRKAFEWLAAQDVMAGQALPKMHASQFAGCAPIAQAYSLGRALSPWGMIDTPRGGMRTPNPPRGEEVLRAIAGGGAHAAAPGLAVDAVYRLARLDGVQVALETGSALVALEHALSVGTLSEDAEVVVLNTASPLKSDPAYLRRTPSGAEGWNPEFQYSN